MKSYPGCNGDRVKTCPDCNGDGVVDKDTDDERQCPTCGGLGFVRDDDDDHEEVIKTSRVALSVSSPSTLLLMPSSRCNAADVTSSRMA
jgi:DnaJ-class molecular chaperone